MQNKITGKSLLMLQGGVALFSITSVLAKFASEQEAFTFRFFFFYGAEVAVLAVYAILWQQIIKRFDISIAYANKALVLLWGMLWSLLIFGETVSLKKVIGVLIVVVGVVVLNLPEKDSRKEERNA